MNPRVMCPYCNCPTALAPARYVYGQNANKPRQMLYFCLICGARVGCHKTGPVPMGTPADKATRKARREAHEAFDRIWKSGRMTRWEAYLWLAQQMGLPQDKTHIGMFDAQQCARVVQICRERKGK